MASIRHILLLLMLFPLLPLHAQEPESEATYVVFHLPDGQPYVDVYLQLLFNGETGEPAYQVTLSNKDTILLTQEYRLEPQANPERKHSRLIERLQTKAAPGTYSLQLEELSATGTRILDQQIVEVSPASDAVALSDIVLCDTLYQEEGTTRLHKNGLLLLPLFSSIDSGSRPTLSYYVELYNSHDSRLYLRTYLTRGNQSIGSSKAAQPFSTNETTVLTGHIDVQDLQPGPYSLHVEVLNVKNQLLVMREHPFRVKAAHNPAHEENDEPVTLYEPTVDELAATAGALLARKEYREAKRLVEAEDSMALSAHVRKYWKEFFPDATAEEWNNWFIRLAYVQEQFGSSVQPGHETDRGRTFLRYGPPTRVVPYMDEPAAYPYEIWEYNQLPQQAGGYFVFINTTYMPNDYVLLHSSARGETRNPSWRRHIYSRTDPGGNFDNNMHRSHFGSQLDNWF